MITHPNPPNLREQAETLLRQSPRDIRDMPFADIQALIYELQVHQIELEMQNEELYKAQQDLQESRDRFADLYDFAPVGYLTLDAQKKIVEANLTAATMLKIERAELVGRKLSDFIMREEQDRFYLFFQALFGGKPAEHDTSPGNYYGIKHTSEFAMHKSSGMRIWCSVECVVFHTSGRSQGSAFDDETPAAGDPDLLCRIALIDITQRNLAEQAWENSDAELKTLANMIPDILYVCDSSGKIKYISQQFNLFTGIPRGGGEDYGWHKAVHPDDLKQLQAGRLLAMQRGEPWEGKFRMRSAAGDYHWFISRVRPLRGASGKIEKWLGSDTDIDQLICTEQALKEVDRRKNEFLAMLAHELRNPLAPIRNAAQLLHACNLDEARLTWVRELLERNVAHIVRLVDDLLDTARINNGTIKLQKQRLNLATIIERAVETARPVITAKNHQLQVQIPAQPMYLEGDVVRLTQIFTNILNNAAKYTAEGGRIDLQAGTENAYAVVRIRDNGMGIPAELLAHVFDMFRQDERGLDRAQGGLGIGLTLVKKLVELHGGEVTVHSAGDNHGAEFVVRLPRLAGAETQRETAVPSADSGAPQCKQRILLVEDNPDAAQSLASLLGLYGHQVAIAHDGQQGLAIAQQFKPDAILLDIGIPGMDGYELARQLRAIDLFRDTLIIALSGYAQRAEDEQHAGAFGIDHYLVKPADFDRLLGLLNKACAR